MSTAFGAASIARWQTRGVSQEIRQKLTGHASAQMNAIYTHHELEPLRAAISVIPSLGVPG